MSLDVSPLQEVYAQSLVEQLSDLVDALNEARADGFDKCWPWSPKAPLRAHWVRCDTLYGLYGPKRPARRIMPTSL